MSTMIDHNSGYKKIMLFAASIIIIAAVMASKTIIIPILLAIFLSIICIQPILFLEKKKIPFQLAMGLVLGSMGFGLFFLLGFVGNSFAEFIKDLPIYEGKLHEKVLDLINNLNNFGADINPEQLIEVIDPGEILNFTAVAAGEMGRILSDSFIIIFIMIFILLETKSFLLKIKLLENTFGNSLEYLNTISVSIRHYLSIKTYVSIVTGLIIWLWLYLIGVQYAVLWGVIAFLLNYIPNIGSLLAAIPTLIFSFIQLGFEGMLWTALCYVVVNIVMGSIVEPKVMGKGLGLSTLVVFLALIIWGFILGTVGMFLSIPLTITIKIILEQNDRTKWIAVLLGTEKETKQMLNET